MAAMISPLNEAQKRLASWGGSLVFLALDPLMALGMGATAEGHQLAVVCWDQSPAVGLLRDRGVEVLVLGPELQSAFPEAPRSTVTLAQHPRCRELFDRRRALGPVGVLAFKPNRDLEQSLSGLLGLSLLAAPVPISRGFENKLKFFEKVRGHGLSLPVHRVFKRGETSYSELAKRLGPRFVLQSGASFSGAGTWIVDSAAGFDAISARHRRLRASAFVHGLPATVNACVTRSGVVVGSAIEQLTGWRSLTPHLLGSCGNIWDSPRISKRAAQHLRMATAGVGEALAAEGFLGHFGVDAIIDLGERAVVIECNPRFTASLPLDSLLSVERGEVPLWLLHAFTQLGIPTGGLEPRQPASTVTQLILRHEGAPAETGSMVWGRWSRDQSFTASPHGLLDPESRESAFLATGEGRQIEPGSELARVILRGELDEESAQATIQAAQQRLRLRPAADPDEEPSAQRRRAQAPRSTPRSSEGARRRA